MLNFILPSAENRGDVREFYDEMSENGDSCIGMGGYKDYDKWLAGMQNRFTGSGLPEGYVRENFYLCYDGELLADVFSLKFELTDYLLNYGGHIGYAVRPSQRSRGLAARMLRRGLELAKGFGFERVLCVRRGQRGVRKSHPALRRRP